MKRRIKIWICTLFHKKETYEMRVPDELFTFSMGMFRGCKKCDVWRQVDDDCK